MATWADGDFVLANSRVAIVIEDVGPSDLYDPWGGRPVGIAKVSNGALTAAADFGEFFVLAGRFTVVTQSVSVLSDGSDGGAAIVRASGPLAPLPFFDAVTSALIRDDLAGVHAAIDYVLEPDSNEVNISIEYYSTNETATDVGVVLHGFMYGKRMPIYAPGTGFGADSTQADYLGFIDPDATSYAYDIPGEVLMPGIAQSGFSSNLSDGFEIAGCSSTTRAHSRLTIGGPGLDGLREAIAESRAIATRAISGTVRDSAGLAVSGARVHATAADGGYVTRSLSDDSGNYTLHVDENVAVDLYAFRRGDELLGPVAVAAGSITADLNLPPSGLVHVVATDVDGGGGLPVRVQVLPAATSISPVIPTNFGERPHVAGRAVVDFPATGDTTLRLPVGQWEVVVSRGYEYELHREVVTIAADATIEVLAPMTRSVDSTGLMCADYHIHTVRSADGVRTAAEMATSAIADGLDIVVRSDHEFISDFEPAISEVGLEEFAFGVASVEMTSLEVWGHMGLLPAVAVTSQINNGAPTWQRFPTAANPSQELELINPVDVFATVRARPEASRLIINHPVGATNYFGYASLDLATATPAIPDVWDESFTTIEALNGSSFSENRDRSIAAWFSLLNSGRPMFVVGSSDAHGLDEQGTGYPRTCLRLDGTPRGLTSTLVADATFAGRSIVVGGIYVTASVAGAAPGETITTGAITNVDVVITAPTWVDVDGFEVIVDGVSVETVAITAADADPLKPAIRYRGSVALTLTGNRNWVVVAAAGDEPLEPVTVDALPFGVTNPIFLER